MFAPSATTRPMRFVPLLTHAVTPRPGRAASVVIVSDELSAASPTPPLLLFSVSVSGAAT